MKHAFSLSKFGVLVLLAIVATIMFSACNLQQTKEIPSTPTIPLEIPVIAAETEEVEEEAEVETEEVDAEEETEEIPTQAPTETPKPQATATAKPEEVDDAEEEDAGDEEAVEAETKPTEIPFMKTSNNDPMVVIYAQTNCYETADLDSKVIGVATGVTALGAFNRDWNWYRVVHPTTGGLTCWVTGDNIRPNQTAFNLGN